MEQVKLLPSFDELRITELVKKDNLKRYIVECHLPGRTQQDGLWNDILISNKYEFFRFLFTAQMQLRKRKELLTVAINIMVYA